MIKSEKWYGYQRYYLSSNKYITSGNNTKYISITTTGWKSIAPVHTEYIPPQTFLFTGRNEVVAKVIFLYLSVILFTGGMSASLHAGIHPTPPKADTAQEQTLPLEQTPPPRPDTPTRSRHPPGADTPQEQTHPLGSSYWNAFLFTTISCQIWSVFGSHTIFGLQEKLI